MQEEPEREPVLVPAQDLHHNSKDGPCGKTLEPFCDKIYHSKELTEDEIAKQILKQKAS